MPDTKLSAITEEATEFNDDDRIYLVQEDGSPVAPVSKFTTFATLRDAIQTGAIVNPATNGFRAGPGTTDFSTLQPQAPSGSDTGAETLTLGAAFPTGTRFVSSATSGGLTAATLYYAHKVDATKISVHTSLADAIADSSRVNITGTPAATLTPSGIEHSTISVEPVAGSLISLQNGSGDWEYLSSAGATLAHGTVSAGDIRSLFAYNNAGTLTLEWGSVWGATTTFAQCPEDCEMVDGVPLKIGNHTRRFIAAVRANTTVATIVDGGGIITMVGAKIFMANWDNPLPLLMALVDTASSWTYDTATWQQWHAAAGTGNKVELLTLGKHAVDVVFQSRIQCTVIASPRLGLGLDSITEPAERSLSDVGNVDNGSGGTQAISAAHLKRRLKLGYHYIAALEIGGGSGTNTFMGGSFRGIRGTVWA